jgi:heat induced stress protein YflT
MTVSRIGNRPVLSLNYPISLAVYDSYEKAERAVGHLSDNAFPVQNVAIVGTGLRSIERVTGRLTRGRRALGGTISGLWLGMFVGLAFALFSKDAHLGVLIATPLLGALFGLVWSQLGFAAASHGGTRDFSSVSQVVATNYEVVVEHRLAEHARELLATTPVR